MVMLVTRKALNVLQRRKTFSTLSMFLCRRLSRLAQSDMHAVLRVRCRSKEGYTMFACAGLSNTDFRPPSAVLRPQTVQTQAPTPRICSSGVCELLRPARPQ